jgi:hypothetical protein
VRQHRGRSPSLTKTERRRSAILLQMPRGLMCSLRQGGQGYGGRPPISCGVDPSLHPAHAVAAGTFCRWACEVWGRSDLIRKTRQTRKCPKEIQGFVPTRAGSKKRPDIGAHLQTMTESLHYGRVTWFNGSGQHFRRFNQMRQPNGAGIGTRQSGTVHKNTLSASDTRRRHEPRRY